MKTLLAFLLLSAPAFATETTPKIDPATPVAVTLTASEWQAVAASVQSSDRLSARDAQRIFQEIAVQVNRELSPQPKDKPK